MTHPTRVLLADAHPVVRLGLRSILSGSSDLSVVGECPCAAERVSELAAELDPDVVVAGGPDAAAVVARLRAENAGRKVLLVSACEEPAAVQRALAAGASGYALKRAAAEELVRAVRAVAAGGTYLDPGLTAVAVGDGLGGLSEGEGQVLRLVALGYSNKEIAPRLRLSVKTVETYKARALEKLGLDSRVDLVRYAVQHGWLTEGAATSEGRQSDRGRPVAPAWMDSPRLAGGEGLTPFIRRRRAVGGRRP